MSKAVAKVLATVSLPACAPGGFHTGIANLVRCRLLGRRRTAATTWGNGAKYARKAFVLIIAETRRKPGAAHCGDPGRADERAGSCDPVRRRHAEALVGEQHDADLRGVRARAGRMVPVGIQDGLWAALEQHRGRPSDA